MARPRSSKRPKTSGSSEDARLSAYPGANALASPVSLLTARRPSWTPSLPEFSEHSRQFMSSSRSSNSPARFDSTEDGPSSTRRFNPDLNSPAVASPMSLLSTRRSWPPLPESSDSSPQRPANYSDTFVPSDQESSSPHAMNGEPSSPEDGNLRRSLQIDMKGLVGDAVGNMSISPSSRDVVLAARRGLFIIDLEAPLEVPRFLPQGGTWDVADVQWNPHPSHAEYIVSTSSQKLLIWNLFLVGKTSIEHILHSHYRAITDINWHTTERDTVVSTGIDSWLWAWDLREPRKPILGLSAFNAGGTQVKWNRHDPNMLASAHANDILIWDRRKGSLPVSKIEAHNSKIYGIDWSHSVRNEIVTCSLDRTIKVWDIDSSMTPQGTHEPKTTIRTNYPVWRARNLPFGEGVLSLAQRGEAALEMYAHDNSQTPVEIFEGHTDVVKEFVWRKKGRQDRTEFQLITWSKDRTLRFWPVDTETMLKVGYIPDPHLGRSRSSSDNERMISFRNPPEGTEYPPALSAPVGLRSILAEVRAPLPPRLQNPVLQPHHGSSAHRSSQGYLPFQHNHKTSQSSNISGSGPAIVSNIRRGGTMSRGNMGGRSAARMDAFTWLSNVKVGERRGSSGSGQDSAGASRPASGPDRQKSEVARSDSRSRAADERREGEGNQSLQDEITSVLTRLASSKIRLEKAELTKKRTCTLGLHGPWGESSSVFIRVSFTFPKDYPHASHPDGTPTVELERNPLIAMKDRAFILRRLRALRERRRPCLEACLRFLLFANEDDQARPLAIDSETSSEDERPESRKSKDFTLALIRNSKNLAEPRTSQGTFGPNGEFVCFFQAPPRFVRNALRGLSASSTKPSQSSLQESETGSRFFQAPALVFDAVRRLDLAATDRLTRPAIQRRDSNNIPRTITSLLTFSHQKPRRDSEHKPLGDASRNYSVLPTRRSSVFITNTTKIAGADKKVALDYVFESDSLADVCEKNALAAKKHGRYDHERVFRTLRTLFPTSGEGGRDEEAMRASVSRNSLTHQVIALLYSDFSKGKDIQMLAMTSMILLQAWRLSSTYTLNHVRTPLLDDVERTPLGSTTPKFGGVDYFSLVRPEVHHPSPASPNWARLPSSPPSIPLSTSNSSRGSWSSLFNSGSVRQFMTGVQDTLKEGLTTPEILSFSTSIRTSIPVHRSDRVVRGPDSPTPRRRGHWRDTSKATTTLSKSWNETSTKTAIPFSIASHRRPTITQPVSRKPAVHQKFVWSEPERDEGPIRLFEPDLISQFICHVQFYAEMLFSWQLYHKRLELLKSVNREVKALDIAQYGIDLTRTCPRCAMMLLQNVVTCPSCGCPSSMPHCSICSLPVKGLSRTCVRCLHVTHVECWRKLDVNMCPTGCGCLCATPDIDTRPSSRLVRSPRSAVSVLSYGT